MRWSGSCFLPNFSLDAFLGIWFLFDFAIMRPVVTPRYGLPSAICEIVVFVFWGFLVTQCGRVSCDEPNKPSVQRLAIDAIERHRNSFVEFCIEYEINSKGNSSPEEREGLIVRQAEFSIMEDVRQAFREGGDLRLHTALSAHCPAGLVTFDRSIEINKAPRFIENPKRIFDEHKPHYIASVDPKSTFIFGPDNPFWLGLDGKINEVVEKLRSGEFRFFFCDELVSKGICCVVPIEEGEFKLHFGGDSWDLLAYSRKWTIKDGGGQDVEFEMKEIASTSDNEVRSTQVFSQLISGGEIVLRKSEVRVVRHTARSSFASELLSSLDGIPKGLEVQFTGSSQLKGSWDGKDVRLNYISSGMEAVQNDERRRDVRAGLISTGALASLALLAIAVLAKSKGHGKV